MIKVVLILGLVSLLLYFRTYRDNYRLNASKKIVGLLFVSLAICSVIFPQLLDSLAKSMGIGRGADLLLYFLTLSYLFTLLNIYLHNRQMADSITSLARQIALLEAAQTPSARKRSNNRRV